MGRLRHSASFWALWSFSREEAFLAASIRSDRFLHKLHCLSQFFQIAGIKRQILIHTVFQQTHRCSGLMGELTQGLGIHGIRPSRFFQKGEKTNGHQTGVMKIIPTHVGQGFSQEFRSPHSLRIDPRFHLLHRMLTHGSQSLVPLGPQGSRFQPTGRT